MTNDRPARVSPAAHDRPVVFVIDDDPSVRRGLDRLLRSAGIEVQTFRASEEFLALELPDRPACVVLDLRLPGASGLELQESLARKGRQLPIIFISGYADVASSIQAMKGGAIDFLEKPILDSALLDVVQRAVERDREARLQRSARAIVRERFDRLTAREREVLELVVEGRLNKQIAEVLGISEKTVKFHRGRVMHKTEAGSVAELVRQADALGIRRAR